MSIEGGSVYRLPSGEWAVCYGFVDALDDRWKIGIMTGESPPEFDAGSHQIALAPAESDVAGVKDPVVIRVGGEYHMLVSYHKVTGSDRDAPDLTSLADTIATGRGTSNSGLALSTDGRNWTWEGDILSPRPGGWDSFCARITGIIPAGVGYLAFYDGSADVSENYEERSSLAWSPDLRGFTPLATSGPLFTSPHATGSVRYVAAEAGSGSLFLYYEMARPDGAHELRAAKLKFPY